MVWGIINSITKGKVKIRTPVELFLNIYPPDKRKRDIDNILKCLLDALQDSQLIENDNLINKLSLVKHEAVLDMIELKIVY